MSDLSDPMDLALDVAVERGAVAPRFETPSASEFSIFSNEEATLVGNNWVPVRTGLRFSMPFMLTMIVRGTGCEWEVRIQVVDYDSSDELVVHLRHPAHWDTTTNPVRVFAGTRVATGLILPIARPAFSLCETSAFDEYDDAQSV